MKLWIRLHHPELILLYHIVPTKLVKNLVTEDIVLVLVEELRLCSAHLVVKRTSLVPLVIIVVRIRKQSMRRIAEVMEVIHLSRMLARQASAYTSPLI